MQTIDLNADLGEGSPNDASIIPLVTSANIACAGHAGNTETIRRTVALALQHQVAIGAHPGYEDPENFGRTPMHLTPGEIRTLTLRQLDRILTIYPTLHHVKPHGALYNQANTDPTIATALVSAIAELLPHTILYCPPSGELTKAATAINLPTCPEAFIDRSYQENGNLTPRTQPGAVIEHANKAALQALKIENRQHTHRHHHPPKSQPSTSDTPNSIATLKLTPPRRRSRHQNFGPLAI